MKDLILNNKNEKELIILELTEYYHAIPNIDRACSSVIENSISIFLPLTRIDKSKIYKKFISNNQTLEIDNELFEKVEIKGRLLGQIHKDVLESLLTLPKIYSKNTAQFKIKTTAYKLLQQMQRNTSDKKWLIQKLDEIKECGIKLFYKNANEKDESFNFGFISSIKVTEEKQIEITFSPEYTYFLAKNELLDYGEYIDDILSLKKEMKKIQEKLKLKRGINTEFIKAIIRYMLIHKGNNSQISIDNLTKKLKLDVIMTKEELKDNLIDLKRELVQKLLKDKFGIKLTKEDKSTLSFNSLPNKKHYYLNNNKTLF